MRLEMTMRRAFLAVALLLAAPVTARSQQQGLRDKISQLFIFGPGEDPLFLAGSAGVNNPASIRAHGNHFIPSAAGQNGAIIGFLIDAISVNVSNLPIGSTSGGETFRFEGGVPVRTSTSAGPIFAERAQTMGRGRALVGIGRNTLHFSSLRGVPLSNIELFFTHQNVDFEGCSQQQGADCKLMGVPNLENDIMHFQLNLDMSVDVTSLYATYGVFDNLDVGVVLPFVNARLHGHSEAQIIPFGGPTAAHFFSGTPTDPVLSASRAVDGSASGLGDLAVRAKLLLRETPGASLAILGQARFATGAESDLLGSGAFSARGIAILSARIENFSPHANVGYVYRAGETQNSAVLATGGFDQLIASGVTIAADLVSEFQVGRSKLTLPGPVKYDVPFKRTVLPTSIPDTRDDIVNGSFGFKFQAPRGFIIVANALVPLNRDGLRSNLILTGAVEYSF
jgi:hypothetical protein